MFCLCACSDQAFNSMECILKTSSVPRQKKCESSNAYLLDSRTLVIGPPRYKPTTVISHPWAGPLGWAYNEGRGVAANCPWVGKKFGLGGGSHAELKLVVGCMDGIHAAPPTLSPFKWERWLKPFNAEVVSLL